MEAHGRIPENSQTRRRHVDISCGDKQCNTAYLSADGETRYYCGLPQGHEGTHEDAYGYEFPKDTRTFQVEFDKLFAVTR